jgi:putative CocE/NonD family hydrolase
MMSASDTVSPAYTPGGLGEHRYQVEVLRDVRIPTADARVSLSGDLFLPVGAGIVPALVTLLPYRKDASAGIQLASSLRWFAARGYASLLADFRGTGSSDGEQRPPFDPAEADDGVAAVEWAAEQPWCTGHVGMWGHSYGAIMAMRTASRRPPHLKAVIPVMGLLDPEHDFVHPSGSRGCLGSLARWGTETLLSQLLPPLDGHGSAAEQRRWQQRLHAAQPWLLDLVRHGPGDPVWRSRVVDASAICVPSFCVAGWRDLFCEATVRAFERIDAPKKLLAGPWMHTTPEDSPFDPVDFRLLALRWWDHWLSGIDTGIMDEPGVTVYLQGAGGGWRQFDSWPPGQRDQRLATAADTTLRPQGTREESGPEIFSGHVIAAYRPDPTVGSQSGLWSLPTSGFGRPLDEHDDDLRSLTCTSDGLARRIVIGGRPTVIVKLAPGSAPPRLVVRLTDVDQQDRSTLITAGVVSWPPPGLDAVGTVELAPTCYAIPAGHRVRVVLGDADFPRLWPSPAPGRDEQVLRLLGLVVSLPIVADEQAAVTSVPEPGDLTADSPPVAVHQRPRWAITRDLISDGLTVTVGQEAAARTPNLEHLLEIRQEMSATVRPGAEAAALVRGTLSATARMGTGETITVRVDLHMTCTTVTASGQVDVDGVTAFSRRWDAGAPLSAGDTSACLPATGRS